MDNENMKLYEAVRVVPNTAKKEIIAGRLKGKTDINPMWRIKTLTEQFGPAGQGWQANITERWVDRNEQTGEAIANIVIILHYKEGDKWNDVMGVGGAMLISNEKNGPYTDDEAWKKAYTDAISVACKALGIGADVYWDKDATKYSEHETDEQDTGNTQKAKKAVKETAKEETAATSESTSKSEVNPKAQAFAQQLNKLIEGTTLTIPMLNAIAKRDYGTEIAGLNDEQREALYNKAYKYIHPLA